jgi:hypothetical protein
LTMIDFPLKFEVRIVARQHNVTLYKHGLQVASLFA